METAVIVPSCRESELIPFTEAWRGGLERHGARLYVVEDAQRRWRFHRIDVDHRIYNDFPWYTAFIQEQQRRLLGSYDLVLFTEPDELVWSAAGLDRYLDIFGGDVARTNGYAIWHDRSKEPPKHEV